MARLIMSPTAIVRALDGAVWVHAAGGQAPLVATPALVETLFRFAAAADAQDTNEEQTLREIGALVQVSEAAEVEPDDASLARLGAVADAIHRVAGHFEVLGPRLADIPARLRVESLLVGTNALESALEREYSRLIARQLEELGVTNESRGLKLHLGAGKEHLAGWLNSDLSRAELSIDVRRGLPFRDGAVDYVFASHLLEHLYYPGEVEQALREIHRVLSPKGRVRIIVPDTEKAIMAYANDDTRYFEDRKKTWTWWAEAPTKLTDFLAYSGAGPRPSSFFEAHKFGYDFATLADVLRRAGFSTVEQSDYMQSADPELRVDHASSVAAAKYGDTYYSLFVEAAR